MESFEGTLAAKEKYWFPSKSTCFENGATVDIAVSGQCPFLSGGFHPETQTQHIFLATVRICEGLRVTDSPVVVTIDEVC